MNLSEKEAFAIWRLTSACKMDGCFDLDIDERGNYCFIDYENQCARRPLNEGLRWLYDACDDVILDACMSMEEADLIRGVFKRFEEEMK